MSLGPHLTPGCFAGVRVLIVDDSYESRRLMVKVLAIYGAEIIQADDAHSAREALARAKPDLLLCDLAMPGEDGVTFIRSVRAIPELQDLLAIAVSAYSDSELDAEVRDAGFDRRITKGSLVHGLPQAILELLPPRLVSARQSAPVDDPDQA